MNVTIENKIASFINEGTDLSERKLAEHFDVPRSVIRRVKAHLGEYTIKKVVEVEVKQIHNLEKMLSSKSAHKKPAEISMIIFRQSKEDFEEFNKSMLGKSKAYVRDQFLRCLNKNRKEIE